MGGNKPEHRDMKGSKRGSSEAVTQWFFETPKFIKEGKDEQDRDLSRNV